MRLPLATDYKTRTNAPDKDAKLRNSYIEAKNGQAGVRKRPTAQGGIAVGTGVAQGGIGLTIAGTNYVYLVYGDVGTLYSGAGADWTNGANYVAGPLTSNWTNYSSGLIVYYSYSDKPIIWTGTYYIMLGYSLAGAAVFSSTDGHTWSTTLDGLSPLIDPNIIIAGSTYIAMENLGTASLNYSYSADGLTWTHTTGYQLPGGATQDGIDCVYVGGIVYAITSTGDTMYTATPTTASSWTYSSTLTISGSPKGIVHDGTVFCVPVSTGTSIYVSNDALTWTAKTLPNSRTWTAGVAQLGSIIAVLSNDGYCVVTSDHGTTWTEVYVGVVNGKIRACNDKFIISEVSTNTKTYYYSSTGLTWTSSQFATAGQWLILGYGNAKYIANDYLTGIMALSSSGT